jgi:hypothetical protein
MEAAVPGLAIAGLSRAEGALALVLLMAFSAALLRARGIVGSEVPCGCFGGPKARDYRLLLTRNGALGLLAALVLVEGGSTDLTGLSAPHLADLVPAALLAAAVLLGFLVVRQAGAALRARS